MSQYDESPIDPVYSLETLDGESELYVGPIEQVSDDATIEGEGRLRFRWLPRPGVALSFAAQELPIGQFQSTELRREENPRKHYNPLAKSSYGLPTGAGALQLAKPHYRVEGWLPHTDLRFGDVGAATRSVVNVVNLDALEGQRKSGGQRGRFVLEADDWKVIVEPAPGATSPYISLRQRGGYAFTHVIGIELRSGDAFDVLEYHALTEAIATLLSFARGGHVGLAMQHGWDANHHSCFVDWSVSKVDVWRTYLSWCDPNHADELGTIFPELRRRLADDFWRPVLLRAIGAYLSANKHDPVDLAPVTSQIGLELIGWAVLVQSEGWLLPGHSLDAHEVLRLLLMWAGIPTSVPEQLSVLAARARGQQEVDGPTLVTQVRNSIVHPPRGKKKKTTAPDPDLVFDAWILSQWYLELVLLRVLGYEGSYANRLKPGRWSGEVEPVPWASQAPKSPE